MSEAATLAPQAWAPRAPHGAPAAVGKFARRHPLGAIGAAVVLLLILAAFAAPIVAPYDPLETDFLAQLQGPSAAHPLGADQFGRDVLSRLLFGARTALLVGFTSAILGTSLGALL